jgi:hypothetical protein
VGSVADEHGTARLQAIRLGWVEADEANVEPILRTAQADIRYVVGLYDALAAREQTLRQTLEVIATYPCRYDPSGAEECANDEGVEVQCESCVARAALAADDQEQDRG